MYPKIKFSKDYFKLHGQKEAMLLNVKVMDYGSLNKELIEYDAAAKDGSSYEFPRGALIHLTFLGNLFIPFCTIRKYTRMKELYYRENLNKVFTILVGKSL
jgi:hypothetical protein